EGTDPPAWVDVYCVGPGFGRVGAPELLERHVVAFSGFLTATRFEGRSPVGRKPLPEPGREAVAPEPRGLNERAIGDRRPPYRGARALRWLAIRRGRATHREGTACGRSSDAPAPR